MCTVVRIVKLWQVAKNVNYFYYFCCIVNLLLILLQVCLLYWQSSILGSDVLLSAYVMSDTGCASPITSEAASTNVSGDYKATIKRPATENEEVSREKLNHY